MRVKNNKIQKALFGKILKKMWNTLSNATQVAQIAESPSVMTAAGWRVDRNGKALQDLQNNPAVKLLRDNLATIGEAATIAPTGVQDVELAYQAVRHPVLTARAIKSAATQAMKASKQLVTKGKNAVLRFKERKNLIGKIDLSNTNEVISPSDPRNAVLGQTNLYPDFSEMTRAEKMQYLKTQKELAEKVDLARNLDALRMTKDRLRNGGFKRIRDAYKEDVNQVAKESAVYHSSNPVILRSIDLSNETRILSEKPIRGNASQISDLFSYKAKKPIQFFEEYGGMGGTEVGFSDMVNTSKKLITKRKANKGAAHEFGHFLYWPASRPKGFDPASSRYLWGKNSTVGSGEIAMRGTELKNYFGLKEGENLTPEMWDFARRHYLTDVGYNNGTLTMFNNTVNSKSPRFSLFLLWLNKRAPAVGGITTGGLTLNTLNNGNNY